MILLILSTTIMGNNSTVLRLNDHTALVATTKGTYLHNNNTKSRVYAKIGPSDSNLPYQYYIMTINGKQSYLHKEDWQGFDCIYNLDYRYKMNASCAKTIVIVPVDGGEPIYVLSIIFNHNVSLPKKIKVIDDQVYYGNSQLLKADKHGNYHIYGLTGESITIKIVNIKGLKDQWALVAPIVFKAAKMLSDEDILCHFTYLFDEMKGRDLKINFLSRLLHIIN